MIIDNLSKYIQSEKNKNIVNKKSEQLEKYKSIFDFCTNAILNYYF